ncbi:MAG: hypothetical protein K2N25_01350 [Muribaculaceae bacterium]|nr:hypothetical protein [Muribaculaceae bacterium]
MATTPQAINRQFSAQGSISIQRLRTGDLLFVTFENLTGKPLYQALDTDNGNTAVPSWSGDGNDGNRPVVRPKVASNLGTTSQVIVNQPTWKYNGTAISFVTAANAESWALEDSANPRFAFRASDMAIKPVANLVGPNSLVNGVLSFSCVARVDGVDYSASKSIDVILARGGASSFYGFITATSLTLDADNPSTILTASLYCGGTEVAAFHTKWYRDRDHLPAQDGKTSLEVDRSNVDSSQLYIVEFYKTAADSQPVACAGVTVVDTSDDYRVDMEIVSANQYISDANPSVTVKAHLVSKRTGAFQTANVKWMLDVIDKETLKSIKSSNTDTIVVTTAETDRLKTIDGEQVLVCSDVSVLAEATWGLNFSVSPEDMSTVVPYWRDVNYVKGEASVPEDRVMINFDN